MFLFLRLAAPESERDALSLFSPFSCSLAVFSYFIEQDHHTEEKVGVFYCGPKSLGNMLSKHCKVATASSSTTFTFAKENF
jgi:hypothetical protein